MINGFVLYFKKWKQLDDVIRLLENLIELSDSLLDLKELTKGKGGVIGLLKEIFKQFCLRASFNNLL